MDKDIDNNLYNNFIGYLNNDLDKIKVNKGN